MRVLKVSCSLITKLSCMAFTCLSLVQSPSGRLLTELESILIITFVFSGSSWACILLGEYFSGTIKQTSLTKELTNVNNTRRGKDSKGG